MICPQVYLTQQQSQVYYGNVQRQKCGKISIFTNYGIITSGKLFTFLYKHRTTCIQTKFIKLLKENTNGTTITY